MSSSFYEIIELANGEIALQRADGDGEMLVRVSFSDEVKFFLQDQHLEVAKAMINTGIRIVGQIQREEIGIDMDIDDDDDEYDTGHTLH